MVFIWPKLENAKNAVLFAKLAQRNPVALLLLREQSFLTTLRLDVGEDANIAMPLTPMFVFHAKIVSI